MNEQQLLQNIERIARDAGETIRRSDAELVAHRESMGVVTKEGHANFVTKYDTRVQHQLIDALSALLPEAHFVGEEEGQAVFRPEYKEGYTFVIDPIDGTSNFMRRYRPSVTSIGLLKDGAPYAGVVYAPFTDQLFSALRGLGAYENGKPFRSSDDPLAMSLVTFGTAPYWPELFHASFAYAEQYLHHCIDIRRSGSAAFDLCMVATGRIGIYFECRTNLYDYCAGAAIALEAGAKVTDLDGVPLDFETGTSIIAATPGVAAAPYLPAELFPEHLIR